MIKITFEIESDNAFSVPDFERITKFFFTIKHFRSVKYIENGDLLHEMTFDRELPDDGLVDAPEGFVGIDAETTEKEQKEIVEFLTNNPPPEEYK